MILGISGYTSVFSGKDGVLKVHLSLLHLAEDVTKENFRDGKQICTLTCHNYCKS